MTDTITIPLATVQHALEALAIADNIALVGAAYTPKSIDLGLRKIRNSATALQVALEQPVQEPVSCRFCHSKKGCWAWQCDSCGETDDVQQPAPQPEQEPVGEVVEVNNDGFRCEFNRRLAVGTKLYIAPPLPVQEQKPVGQLQECVYGRGQVLWFNKPADKAMLYTDPPVAYDKKEMNSFVIDLYDEKMKEGKHGHYEALFHCVHQAIARVNAPAAQPVQEPVAWVCYGTPGKRDIDFEEADINKLPIGSLLYTAPPAPQRLWVGLTDGEWVNIVNKHDAWFRKRPDEVAAEVAKLVEAILKDKNHG
jgi:hypothetical protein